MPKRRRSGTTEPLRSLAARLEGLRRDADRLLEANEPASAQEPEAPRLSVAPPTATGSSKKIAQRARDASSLFDTGREELLSSLETQIVRRLAPLLERLDIPRRSDLDELARRVADLERRLDALATASAKARKRRS